MPSQGPATDAKAELPRRFGHYDLRKELGRGAQGVVYLADDTRLQRQVALKMLSSVGVQSAEMRERFKREAALTSRIEHPGICGVHEVGEVDGLPYIAMQFLRGATLADLLVRARGGTEGTKVSESMSLTGAGGKGEMQDVMRLVERTARALHAAHEVGLVHRDIKPANIMVTPAGDPVVLDFGLARDIDGEGATLTKSGQIMGTPAYLAPEQIVAERGGVDRRTDVYALGVTLFECLTLQRPYTAQSFDQLFHKILAGNVTNPRGLNPRIPQDLRTVIEVAMDRDPKRRYATAELFAEDLRRVRSFEPIRARAAGPLARAMKWAKRHPARATAVLGTGVAVLVAAGTLLSLEWSRRAAVAENLERATQQLAGADFAAATDSVARALERDPESLRARELKTEIERAQQAARTEARHQEDLAAAAAARAESAAAQQRYAKLQREIDEARQAATAQRPQLFEKYADEVRRVGLATLERSLRTRERESAKLLIDAEEALDRAARHEQEWGGPSATTEAERANFFMQRWRESNARGDLAAVAAFRAGVEQHDVGGQHRTELDGRGTLQIDAVAGELTLHLFRYEGLETVRADDAIPRLVPVPTKGIGRAREAGYGDGFLPGDPCLCIVAVAPGSPAATAGLRTGDLVIGIERQRCGSGLFLRALPSDAQPRDTQPSDALAGKVPPYARVATVNGAAVESPFDWRQLPAAAEGVDRLTFVGVPGEVAIGRASVAVARPTTLVADGGKADLHLQCLRDGEVVDLVVPGGRASGLLTESTAYPLVCSADNLVAAGSPLTVDPGSYLILARGAGMEPLRMPVVVDRGAAVRIAAQLLPDGSTPPGFVWIPPGRARLGGDREAFRGTPLQEVEVPGFMLARLEVSNREYYEFLNDAEVRARLAPLEAAGTALQCVPRDSDGKVLATKQPDGTWLWTAYKEASPETPVLGLSWQDVQQYLAWRNRRAAAAGERWTYDLPGRDEWERAARGADARQFPWGARFDPSLTVCRYRKFDWLLDSYGGFERRDESPFGILDLGGSREEWTRDLFSTTGVGPDKRSAYHKCGGHWQTGNEVAFRIASRKEGSETLAQSSQGFRLVLRPR